MYSIPQPERFLTVIFVAASVGVDALIEWMVVRHQGWNARQAKQVFGVGVVAMVLLVNLDVLR